MSRVTTVFLACLLAFVGGCAGNDESSRPAPNPRSGATTPTATTISAEEVMSLAEACSELRLAASGHVMSHMAALTGSDDHATVRAEVAMAYANFGQLLIMDVVRYPGELVATVLDWSTASTDIAEYITSTPPEPGIVVAYGPALDAWQAAEKAAEKACGYSFTGSG